MPLGDLDTACSNSASLRPEELPGSRAAPSVCLLVEAVLLRLVEFAVWRMSEPAGRRFRVVLVTPNSVSGGGSPPSSSSARQACVRACVRACGSKRIHFEIQVEVFGQAADSRARPRRDSLAF